MGEVVRKVKVGLGKKGLLVLIAVLAVGALIFVRVRTSDRPVAPKPPTKSEPAQGQQPSSGQQADGNPDETGFNFQGTTLKVLAPGTGKVEWELTAKSVDVSETREIATMEQLTARYRDDRGVLSEVSARNVRVEWATRSLSFTGDVEVRARNGAKLTSQELLWDGQQKRYLVDKGVVFDNGGTVLTGEKLSADGGLTSVNVSGNVKLKGAGRQ